LRPSENKAQVMLLHFR